MSQLDDDAVLALQTNFEEVAILSYRLREWVTLELYLRQVETSLKRFYAALERVRVPEELGGQSSTLTTLWREFRDPDLMDLSSFVDGIQYIDQPVKVGLQNYSDPKVGIKALVDVGDNIEQALAKGMFDALKDHSDKFKLTLAAQLANRRTRVRREVEYLCALTDRLRDRLS